MTRSDVGEALRFLKEESDCLPEPLPPRMTERPELSLPRGRQPLRFAPTGARTESRIFTGAHLPSGYVQHVRIRLLLRMPLLSPEDLESTGGGNKKRKSGVWHSQLLPFPADP